MSWWTIVALALGAYAFKVLGVLLLGRVRPDGLALTASAFLPAALLAALVATQTFATDEHLVLDARAAGVAVGALAAWRRAPFWLVITLAAVTTAALRAFG